MDLDTLFQNIIFLEKDNFQKMNRSLNVNYDEAKARRMLLNEHTDDSCIIYCYRDELLVAFLRFTLVAKKINIASLQIRKGYEYNLLKILRDMYNRFKYLDFEFVESQVYKDNWLSLVLHIKLGLHYYKDVGKKLVFLTGKEDFLKSLEKYVLRGK